MKIAIVGLPNVGKSTLFNALTKNNVLAANYPFATIEPNVGIVPVPDERLPVLARLYNADKIVPATVTFVDIAGLVKGASEGQGLGNKFLANIRETDAIVQVVRVFSDHNVQHVSANVDPADDIETINTELVLADLQTVDNRMAKIKKDASQKALVQALEQARELLNEGTTLYGASIDTEPMRELQLLTTKPFIYVFNLDENDLGNQAMQERLVASVKPAEALFVCAKIEAELSELDAAEAIELLQELGQPESGLNTLVRAGQHTLGLQSFLTAGPKEVRAWTIPVGTKAPQAAGVIHTDFEKGFIKAEVVTYEDLVAAGSLPAARAAGKARLEGKDYAMRPDDVVEFRVST